MTDAGYLVKQVVTTPEWLKAPGVREICSVSGCVSHRPDNWIDRWVHNEFAWFNRLSDALDLIPPNHDPPFRVFAYRIHPEVFRAGERHPLPIPADVDAEPISPNFRSIGFDSVNKTIGVLGFECSPLSCNGMAAEMETTDQCLFPSLDAAIAGATRFSIEQPEPGDYYVVEVLERA